MDVLTFESILASLPPSENPFKRGESLVNELRFPTVYTATYAFLIVFSIFHILTALVCLVIILRLVWPSSLKRKVKHRWLFKRIHVVDENGTRVLSTPLFLPNSGLLMACFQFTASTVAQLQIYFTFFSFKHYEVAAEFSLPVWLYFSWLFSFHGFWVMTWASFYTRLYTQKTYAEALRSAPMYIFRPKILNFFFVSISIIVTAVNISLILWISVYFRHQKQHWAELFNSLAEAATAWDKVNKTADVSVAMRAAVIHRPSAIAGANFLSARILDLEQEGGTLLKANRELVHRSRVIASVWALILFFTLMLYVVVMRSLICLIKRAAASPGCRKAKVQIGLVRRSLGANSHANESTNLVDTAQEAYLLRRGLRYLTSHTLLMIFALSYSTAVCIIMGVKAREILLNAYWRGLGSWLSLLSGVIMALAMSFQFWRIWVDLDIIIPVQESRTQPAVVNVPWKPTCGASMKEMVPKDT